MVELSIGIYLTSWKDNSSYSESLAAVAAVEAGVIGLFSQKMSSY